MTIYYLNYVIMVENNYELKTHNDNTQRSTNVFSAE